METLALHVRLLLRRSIEGIVELFLHVLNRWVGLNFPTSPGVGRGDKTSRDHSSRGPPSTHLAVEHEICIGFQPTPHSVQKLGEHPRQRRLFICLSL